MLAEEVEPAIATVGDDEAHESFERIDAETRWAGVAVIDSQLLSSTARMLGDWDLQSTLLRRAIQDGARRIAFTPDDGEPILAESAGQLGDFQRSLMASSRAARSDWPSRFLLPPIEELATERLMETQVKPPLLIYAALALTIAGRGRLLSRLARYRADFDAPVDTARPDRGAPGQSAASAAGGANAQPPRLVARRRASRCSRSDGGRRGTGRAGRR